MRHPAAPALRLLASLGLIVFAATLARAEIELSGLLVTGNKTHFALTDTTTGRTDWTELGRVFAGFNLVGFDAATDTLTLRQAGIDKRIRLKDDAKIKATRLELTGSFSVGDGAKTDVVRATLAYDQETAFPLQDGVTWRITPSRRPDGNILYKFSLERMIAAGRAEQLSAPSVVARPDGPFKIQIGDMKFEFSPTRG